jgi:hypothetical protein
MRADQKAKTEDALERVHNIVSGDSVIWVDKDDVQTALTCRMKDLDSAKSEGLEIDSAGWRMQQSRELSFLKRELTEKEVVIDPSGHFLIDTERWDLAEDESVKTATVPLAGIHNMVEVVVRRAVELNSSTPGTEFTYRD